MTTRAIFNRKYESYAPGSTEVWLINGAGVTTSLSSTQTFTAGAPVIQGDVVYVSGTYVLPASAASGVAVVRYNAIGVTAGAASTSSGVSVVLDNVAVISSANLIGETQLVPGAYYYLAKYSGKLTQYSTTSGVVSASGGYASLVNIGQALSSTELEVEIEPPVVLYD